jgi:hypothetical protein
MKLALIFFSVLTSLSLSFSGQGKPRATCGKPLPIATFPSPAVTSFYMPLRFGGTRTPALPYVNGFPSDKAVRLVIRNRDQFSDYWKQLTSKAPPHKVPPIPEVDFSKETVVVAAYGITWSEGGIFIDGACEVDGQVEVFVSTIYGVCGAQPGIAGAPADAIRLPRTDLPVVFVESKISCTEAQKLFIRSK